MQMNTNKVETKAAAYAGFRQVEKDEFFKTVGQLDVHPCIQGGWSDEVGFVCHWETPRREVLGISDDYADGKPVGCGNGGRYWVSQEL